MSRGQAYTKEESWQEFKTPWMILAATTDTAEAGERYGHRG